jgi:hypothetical protein
MGVGCLFLGLGIISLVLESVFYIKVFRVPEAVPFFWEQMTSYEKVVYVATTPVVALLVIGSAGLLLNRRWACPVTVIVGLILLLDTLVTLISQPSVLTALFAVLLTAIVYGLLRLRAEEGKRNELQEPPGADSV